eukprot:jgi/Botrbrau1/14874/Bobra.0298s0007.1
MWLQTPFERILETLWKAALNLPLIGPFLGNLFPPSHRHCHRQRRVPAGTRAWTNAERILIHVKISSASFYCEPCL